MKPLFALAALALAASAQAQVITIDQAKAMAGNVTPGDAPGFPVTLSRPGSYRLTSALSSTSSAESTIVVTARDVFLDLGGFTIQGPVTCSSGLLPESISCTPSNSIAIKVEQAGAVQVGNGGIRGYGTGVDIAASMAPSRVTNLVINEVSQWGVRGGGRTDVWQTTVHFAQGNGITAGGTMQDNTVSFVAGIGIRPSDGAVLRDNRVIRAATNGILGWSTAIYFATGNVIQQSFNQASPMLNAVSPSGGLTNYCNGSVC